MWTMQGVIKKDNVSADKNFNKTDKYPFIDIFKFIFAICVVAIHTNIFGSETNNMQWYIMHMLLRLAVPFFFISSGFLFIKGYLKDKKSLKERSIRQVKRLLIPFFFWMLVLLPFLVPFDLNEENYILNFMLRFFQVVFLDGCYLWFVFSLAIAIIIEYFVLKKNKLKFAVISSIVLYIIALLGNSYYFLIEGTVLQQFIDLLICIFVKIRNGIFVGFPLFTVGVLIGLNEKRLLNIKNNKLYCLLTFFIFTQFLEATYIKGKNYLDDHCVFVSIVFISAILLILCIKYKNCDFKNIETRLLRNLSTGIYYIHFPVLQYIKYILLLTDNTGIGITNIFFLTVAFTIIIDFILLKINNKYVNMIIK